MRVNPSRNTAATIRHIIDEYLPPALRDASFLMRPIFRMLFGAHADVFLRFKEQGLFLTRDEFAGTYRRLASAMIDRQTDLNRECVESILGSLVGERVLEVGCGRGYLATRMAARGVRVTATDIDVSHAPAADGVTYREAWAESLPFPDASFDTVVCTHTLEHVQNLTSSLRELRRVTARRLIVVVPRQRPYRYTFDLHLHFFPYEFSLRSALGFGPAVSCEDRGGDWFCVEDVLPRA